MPSIRIRWHLVPVSLSLIALATMTRPSPAFQQKSGVNAGNPSTLEDFKVGDENREPYQRASDVVKALKISRGDWVADVGAGAGYYAMRLSDVVGPKGKVYAEDISNSAMGWLNARVKVFELRNVELVKGEIDNPQLPRNRFAAILIVDSYHHFPQYRAMLERILHALKPGGRLVIADYSLADHRTQSRADQLKIHEIDPELVRAEVGRAGFHVVRCKDPFLKRMREVKNARIGAADMWLMVAVRPK